MNRSLRMAGRLPFIALTLRCTIVNYTAELTEIKIIFFSLIRPERERMQVKKTV
jgi:hypothetical protein